MTSGPRALLPANQTHEAVKWNDCRVHFELDPPGRGSIQARNVKVPVLGSSSPPPFEGVPIKRLIARLQQLGEKPNKPQPALFPTGLFVW